MKSYLDLIPISAKIHQKSSRMTRICIFLAVFLVAVIFGMADMDMRSLKIQAIQTDGSWHVGFRNLTGEQAALIAARPEVDVSAAYDVVNYSVSENYTIEGIETVICGFDETLSEMMPAAQTTEGNFPQDTQSVVCTKSIKERLKIRLGDRIPVTKPDGTKVELTVCGFSETTSMLSKSDAFGIFLNTEAFRMYFTGGSQTDEDGMFYVKFVPYCNIQKSLAEIRTQFGLSEAQTAQNAKLLMLLFQSRDPYLMQFYMIAAILSVLVSIAGILMIAGSLSSNVAQRTEFFGVMRALGATPKQVSRFVQREALSWCRSAIPPALLSGTLVIWGLCAMLRFLSPKLFEGMPVFGISWLGILAGLVIGILTVLLAAHAPAKKASRVSPLTAISGNAGTIPEAGHAADTRWLHVETALGIHHARGSLKNFLLISGSFAFSIILFLSFGFLHDFMDHAIVPLRPWSPDLSITSPDHSCSVPWELADRLSEFPAVKRVYGRGFCRMQAELDGKETKIDLVSYEPHQFAWAKESLLAGTLEEAEESGAVLLVHHEGSTAEPKDTISIQTEEEVQKLPVSGILSACPFDREENTELVICSEELFRRLTGENGYTVIDLQLKRNASEEEVQKIRETAGEEFTFSDQRMSNAETMGAYYSFLLFLYGFLTVILLITVFHIINSVSMSVSARIKQYGSMRAIGMSCRQVIRMIAAEAGTYAAFGCLAGCPVGLWIHRLFFVSLITSRWGDVWTIPVRLLLTILLVVLASIILSVLGPAGRIRKMSITETISAA